MKKMILYASVGGLAAGVFYWLCKKEKSNNTVSKSVDNKVDFETKPKEEEIYHESNVVEEMYRAKGESVQAVCKRHLEAGEIMKDAYRNIMEDFVEDFLVKKL